MDSVTRRPASDATLPSASQTTTGSSIPVPTQSGRILFGGLGFFLAALTPTLLAYKSRNAWVLHKYSGSYAAALAILIGTTAVCFVLAALPRLAAVKAHAVVFKASGALIGRPLLLIVALAAPWTLLLGFLAMVSRGQLGHSLLLHLLGPAALLWGTSGLILMARAKRVDRARTLAKYFICLTLVVCALVAAESVLRLRPGMLSARLLYSLPGGGEFLQPHYAQEKPITLGFRYQPGLHLRQRMRCSEANLFIQQPWLLRPIASGGEAILSEAEFTTDENGYRNESPLRDTYRTVVSGDSFASLGIESRPWPTLLSEKLGFPILNLGLQGYGPQSEVEALIRFGIPRAPERVVIAYYEGNDLMDAQRYEERKRSGLGWSEYDLSLVGILERCLVFHAVRYGLRGYRNGAPRGADGDFPYPFTTFLNEKEVELSFSTSHIARLALSRADVKSLAALSFTMETLRRLREQVAGAGAKLLFLYVPTKEHVYMPLIPPELLSKKLGGARRLQVSPQGILQLDRVGRRHVITAPEILATITGQRDVVTARVAAEGIEVLDLTPAFQQAAAQGNQLYFVNDTHWCAAGHELAAEKVAERLREP